MSQSFLEIAMFFTFHLNTSIYNLCNILYKLNCYCNKCCYQMNKVFCNHLLLLFISMELELKLNKKIYFISLFKSQYRNNYIKHTGNIQIDSKRVNQALFNYDYISIKLQLTMAHAAVKIFNI